MNNEPTKIKVSAFRWVPPVSRGLVRDLRVRWALEEVGLAYEEWLIGPEDQQSGTYLALQPLGQVPRYEEDGLLLFESRAIVLQDRDYSANLLRPAIMGEIRKRLASVRRRLGGKAYLEDRFTAADLLMVTVLRILRRSELLEQAPELDAYRLRCEARPAFQRALTDQMTRFAGNAPPMSKRA